MHMPVQQAMQTCQGTYAISASIFIKAMDDAKAPFPPLPTRTPQMAVWVESPGTFNAAVTRLQPCTADHMVIGLLQCQNAA